MWKDLWPLRDKTALFLVPPAKYREQESIAHRLPNTTVKDWRAEVLEAAAPSHRYVNSDVDAEIDRIRKISASDRKTFCLVNTEYFLVRFSRAERDRFWQTLWNGLPHATGVVVLFVLASQEILPGSLELDRWRERGRLFVFEDVFMEAVDAEN